MLAFVFAVLAYATCIEQMQLRVLNWNVKALPKFVRNRYGYVPTRLQRVRSKLLDIAPDFDIIVLTEGFLFSWVMEISRDLSDFHCTPVSHRPIVVKLLRRQGELPHSGVIICSKFDMTLPFTHTFTVSYRNADALAAKGAVAAHILIPCANSEEFYPLTVIGSHMQSEDMTAAYTVSAGIYIGVLPPYSSVQLYDHISARKFQLEEIHALAHTVTDGIAEPVVVLAGDLNVPYKEEQKTDDLLWLDTFLEYVVPRDANGTFQHTYSPENNDFIGCIAPDERVNLLLDYVGVFKTVRGFPSTLSIQSNQMARFRSDDPIDCVVSVSGKHTGSFRDLSDHSALNTTIAVEATFSVPVVDLTITSMPILTDEVDVYLRINGHAYLQEHQGVRGPIRLERNGACWDVYQGSTMKPFTGKVLAGQSIKIELMIHSHGGLDLPIPYNIENAFVPGLSWTNGSEQVISCEPPVYVRLGGNCGGALRLSCDPSLACKKASAGSIDDCDSASADCKCKRIVFKGESCSDLALCGGGRVCMDNICKSLVAPGDICAFPHDVCMGELICILDQCVPACKPGQYEWAANSCAECPVGTTNHAPSRFTGDAVDVFSACYRLLEVGEFCSSSFECQSESCGWRSSADDAMRVCCEKGAYTRNWIGTKYCIGLDFLRRRNLSDRPMAR